MEPVTYTPVESSNVAAVAWHGGDLFVRFHSGGTYRYEGVPRGVFESLLAAPSKGKFLAAHVKGRYEYAKVK